MLRQFFQRSPELKSTRELGLMREAGYTDFVKYDGRQRTVVHLPAVAERSSG